MDRISYFEERHQRCSNPAADESLRLPSAGCSNRTLILPQTTFAWWKPLRFIQQFGPGRPRIRSFYTMVPQLMFILYISSCFTITVSCSSRSTPNRPRPTTIATTRPNITFQTYACPEAYAKWYCLNGATCFAVKIRDSILYNCECADGYMGQRCEFKDLDGSYLRNQQRERDSNGGNRWWSANNSRIHSFYLSHYLSNEEIAAEVQRILSEERGGGDQPLPSATAYPIHDS
ncbi:uncharacterized protein [Parasteatoda tepidariorum]|uniref:uncharacterized protein isoform X3 n=1 Tax=Parasteatoda tepidariorum TaxID=114398 RepID=UPI000A2C0CA2|nr:uncharacterized protein LOC107448055 isoform X3 [Parasteatoda tepidariorum]